MGSDVGVVERPEPQLPDVPRWPESERLAREKEILGFFISGHPLEKFRDVVQVYGQVSASTLKQFRDQKIELACVVTAVNRQISKRNGSEWGRVTVEDFSGTATVLAFGDAWDGYHDLLSQDAPVLIRGTVSGRDRDEDAPPIFLDSVVPLASLRSNGTLALELLLRPDSGNDLVAAALAAFGDHPGEAAVIVSWEVDAEQTVESQKSKVESNGHEQPPSPSGNGSRNGASGARKETRGVRLRSRSIRVAPSDALLKELRSLFGQDRVRLVKA
jgi:DNA polymerase-3 subunit alpha